jgi:type VI secretion system lysozyme-like protein
MASAETLETLPERRPEAQLDPVEGAIEGARPPLFDRLRATVSQEEPLPLGAYRRDELYASLRRELTGLLNTRSPTPLERFAVDDLTVLDYGVPDLTSLHPQSAVDRGRLEALLSRAIATFEPRLREVRVEVQPLPGRSEGLRASAQAVLHVGRLVEPILISAVVAGDGVDGGVTVRPSGAA